MQRGPYRGDHIEAFSRGGRTYFRFNRTVPRELRRLLGKAAWRTYLPGAKSRQNAREMADRLGLATKAALELVQFRRLTPDQISEIEAAGGLDGWRERVKAAGKHDLRPMLEFAVQGLAPQADDDAFVEWGAESILVDNAVARAGAERELARIKTRAKRIGAIEERLGGEGKRRPKLMALVDHWAAQVRPARKTLGKYVLYIERLVTSMGKDIEPRQVTRAHIIKYRDDVFTNHTYGRSVSKHIDAVKAVFSRALSDELVVINPAEGIKLPEIKRTKKRGFTPEQAQTIFKALPDFEPPLMAREDFQWMMKLLAYQGARGGEIAQLRCCDVTTVGGILSIDINELEEDSSPVKTIKNEASIRRVPVHPAIRAQLKSFVRRVRDAHGGDAWLFQSLSDKRKNGRVDVFERAANEGFFLNELGITDKRYRLHSWRHRFRSLCRIAKVPKTHSLALMGHTEGGTHGDYGDRPPLRELMSELRKIDPLRDRPTRR